MIARLVFPTLRVYRSRTGLVPEQKSLEVVKETCALVEAGVSCVEPRVTLWGDEGWEVAAPVGLWTPIMSVPSVFHGDERGTRET